MKKQKSTLIKIADNRIFCMVWLFIGVGYITWFGALKVTYLGVTAGRFVRTASVIAMVHPNLYILWVVFTIVSLWLNILYMYRHNACEGKACTVGKVMMYLSLVCIVLTKAIPHADDFGWRMVVHWASALLIAALCPGSILVFLFKKSKENKRYLYTAILYLTVLILMVVYLIIFEENGAIETLPLWCTYLILYLVNFTNIYKQKPKFQQVAVQKEA